MRATIALLGVALFSGHGAPEPVVEQPRPAHAQRPAAPVEDDVRTFLDAARGADRVICALAAAPVGNGWGDTGAPTADDASLVAWALKPSLDERDLTVLEEGLLGSDDCVRTMAARLLAEVEGGAAVLVDALEHDSPRIRRAGAEGLGFAEVRSAGRQLTRRLEDDADPSVRAAAAWALGRIEDPAAEAALGRALRDSEPFVRRAAVDALGGLELETSIELLLPMLGDTDARIRTAAAHALGRLH